MFDVGLDNAGAKIVLATSCDQKYPPEHIIDGKDDTFWISTGLFPQEFIVSFQSMMNINRVTIVSSNVRGLVLEKSESQDPTDFDGIADRELSQTDGSIQNEEVSVSGGMKAKHLRVVIKSGFDHFVAVSKLLIDGNAIHG